MGAVFVSTLFDTFGIQQKKLKVAFIINGSKKLSDSAREAIDYCSADPALEVHVYKTSRSKEAIELAQKCTEDNFESIIAVGGDGTVNEVLNGVMKVVGKNPILCVLPNGTGNDFVRGTSLMLNPNELVSALKNKQTNSVDIACVTSSKSVRYFINIADVGFGGKVVQVLDRQRRFIGGKASYAIAILRAFTGYRRPVLEITTDDFTYKGSVLMVAICNGRIFGDGLTINPFAEMNDGKLNITLLGKVTLFDYVKNLKNLKSGKVINHPEAIYKVSRKVSIKVLKGEAVGELDGEFLDTGEIEIDVVANGIQLLNY